MRISKRFMFEWRSRAQCLGHEVSTYDLSDLKGWLADRGMDPRMKASEVAALLCRSCPVIRECAADALCDRPRPRGVVRGGVWCRLDGHRRLDAELVAVAQTGVPPADRAADAPLGGEGALHG